MSLCRCGKENVEDEGTILITDTMEHRYQFCAELPDHRRPGANIDTTLKDAVTFDLVNHPPHYTSHPSGVECITITESMGFCVGNALKYIWRADLKNGIEDLEKAKWYIEREIARRKAEA